MIKPSQARRWFLLGAATVLTSPELAASLRKPGSTASIDIVRIAAASDLSFALPEILQHIEKNLGISVRVTYGSSGNFYRQIIQGAPFDVFMSADESLIDRMVQGKDGMESVTDSVVYALGRIALMAPIGSKIGLDENLTGLGKALADRTLSKLAIANPEHAPYGRAAQQALASLGLWPAIQPHLVLGENVAQAAQFVLSGGAQAAIVALSLASAPQLRQAGRYVLIPARHHLPLRQKMLVLARSNRSAPETSAVLALFSALQQPAARAVFNRYGLTLPTQES